MKALTLTEPYATLVSTGAKKLETRSWKTDYRGPLAIHSAKGFPKWAKYLCNQDPFRKELVKICSYWDKRSEQQLFPLDALNLGSIIAVCNLVDIWRITENNAPDEPECSFGDYTPGRWAWDLRDVIVLPEPIPVKGALSLWEVPPDIDQELKRCRQRLPLLVS